MSEPNLFDLGDVAGFLRAGSSWKLWAMVFLLAIRDGGQEVRVVRRRESVRMFLDLGTREAELIPPPFEIVGKLYATIRELGVTKPKKIRIGSLLGWDPPPATDAPPPWSSRFRLKLGDGFKDVSATAEGSTHESILTLRLSAVSIGSEAATARLRAIMEERALSKGSAG